MIIILKNTSFIIIVLLKLLCTKSSRMTLFPTRRLTFSLATKPQKFERRVCNSCSLSGILTAADDNKTECSAFIYLFANFTTDLSSGSCLRRLLKQLKQQNYRILYKQQIPLNIFKNLLSYNLI